MEFGLKISLVAGVRTYDVAEADWLMAVRRPLDDNAM